MVVIDHLAPRVGEDGMEVCGAVGEGGHRLKRDRVKGARHVRATVAQDDGARQDVGESLACAGGRDHELYVGLQHDGVNDIRAPRVDPLRLQRVRVLGGSIVERDVVHPGHAQQAVEVLVAEAGLESGPAPIKAAVCGHRAPNSMRAEQRHHLRHVEAVARVEQAERLGP